MIFETEIITMCCAAGDPSQTFETEHHASLTSTIVP